MFRSKEKREKEKKTFFPAASTITFSTFYFKFNFLLKRERKLKRLNQLFYDKNAGKSSSPSSCLDCQVSPECLGQAKMPLSICPWKRSLGVLGMKSCWYLMTRF
jgi:hypothetical protein